MAPETDQWSGQIRIDTAPDLSTAFSFDLSAFADDVPSEDAANGALPEAPEVTP